MQSHNKSNERLTKKVLIITHKSLSFISLDH